MIFPVVLYGCECWEYKESWVLKNYYYWTVVELWLNCGWRRLLRVPWTARKSNQSILKEISPEYSLEVLMLKLTLWYFSHLMRRIVSFEKALILGKIEAGREGDNRGWDGWMASLTHWTWVWVNSGSWWWMGRPGDCSPWGCKELDTTRRMNWTEQSSCFPYFLKFMSEFFQKELIIWATVCSWFCFC